MVSEVKIASSPDLGQRIDEITIYAGPARWNLLEQFEEVAECVAGFGLALDLGRRRVQASRTNPHSFRKVSGEEALKIMKAAGDKYTWKTLTGGDGLGPLPARELIMWTACRWAPANFQNFSLLEKIGTGDRRYASDGAVQTRFRRHHRRSGLPPPTTSPIAATTTWYICERGIRTSRRPRASRAGHRRRAGHPLGSRCTWRASTCRIRPATAIWCRFGEGRQNAGADSCHDRGCTPTCRWRCPDYPQQRSPAQFRELVAESCELAACLGKKIVRRF